MARTAILLMLAASLLLAGCSGPSATDNAATSPIVTDTPKPALPTQAPASEPPATQDEDLAWLLSAQACTDQSQAPTAEVESYRPELAGTTYDSLVVDPATRGGNYSVAFTVPAGTAASLILFWNGTIGPGGSMVGRMVELVPDGQSLLEGTVPLDADFATVSSCGAPGASAHYIGTGLAKAFLVL